MDSHQVVDSIRDPPEQHEIDSFVDDVARVHDIPVVFYTREGADFGTERR